MSATAPPLELLRSGWLPHIRNFVGRLLSSVAHADAAKVTVSSWFRTFATNRAAGGDPESQHLFALAVDITGPRDVLTRIGRLAQLAGLVALLEGSHLHVQMFPAGALARVGVRFPGAGDLLA